jgi:hypothetical protein
MIFSDFNDVRIDIASLKCPKGRIEESAIHFGCGIPCGFYRQ